MERTSQLNGGTFSTIRSAPWLPKNTAQQECQINKPKATPREPFWSPIPHCLMECVKQPRRAANRKAKYEEISSGGDWSRHRDRFGILCESSQGATHGPGGTSG